MSIYGLECLRINGREASVRIRYSPLKSNIISVLLFLWSVGASQLRQHSKRLTILLSIQLKEQYKITKIIRCSVKGSHIICYI